ncbi:MAG: GNAT family N-acetyltransferase [Spirochaetota bacterium]
MIPFDLTPELLNQMIHAMEDQNTNYLLDVSDGTLRDTATVTDPEAPELTPIPDWEPSDGFELMESFVAGLANPEWRGRLREALTGGRGAFKRFKATAKQNHHVMAAWRRHKRVRMQRRVYDWYNDLRDTWGLNPLEPEEGSEDRQALLFEDFSLRRTSLGPYREAIRELLGAAHRELYRKLPAPLAESLYEEPPWLPSEAPGSLVPEGIVALDPEEALAGVVWGNRRGALLELGEILVRPDYRGIGLGGLLFDRWVDDAIAEGVPYLLIRRGLAHPAIRALAAARDFEATEVGYLYSPDVSG